MSKRLKFILIFVLIFIILVLILVFSIKKKEKIEYQNSENYSKLAILVNGVPSTNIPTDKYYYMSSYCDGMILEWNTLEKKLKIKGTGTTVTNSSCSVNFEEVPVDIKVDGVTNFNPTGDLIISEKNCGDAEVTYSNNKLDIKFNTKPTTCAIKLVIPNLYNQILLDNTEISDSTIDFSGISGSGLYYTNDTAYGEENTTTYYFRGSVSNNWVSFAGYLWRIVRTTSEGGVKLAYSGDGSDTTSAFINTATYFNSTASSKYYTGYTYNTAGYTGTQTNSTVKTVVDNWYNSYLTSYATYLSTTAIFCADRSVETVNGSNRYYPTYERLNTTKRPTFACPATNQSRYTASTSTGNGYLTKPIALLSVDEISFAGLVLGGSTNGSSYIMANANDITSNWWTMSPYALLTSTAATWYVNVSGSISANYVNTQFSVRPAVAIKSCVIVTGGTGTESDPYIISNSKC